MLRLFFENVIRLRMYWSVLVFGLFSVLHQTIEFCIQYDLVPHDRIVRTSCLARDIYEVIIFLHSLPSPILIIYHFYCVSSHIWWDNRWSSWALPTIAIHPISCFFFFLVFNLFVFFLEKKLDATFYTNPPHFLPNNLFIDTIMNYFSLRSHRLNLSHTNLTVYAQEVFFSLFMFS